LKIKVAKWGTPKKYLKKFNVQNLPAELFLLVAQNCCCGEQCCSSWWPGVARQQVSREASKF
jgi:hypothetical protein